jgi:LysR family transcriptional regulator for metE and metH
MSLDRPHLQLLAAVEQHGQLGAAARALHISASAASHRMRDAERRVGIALVEQHGRIVRLTPAGRYLAEASHSVEQQLLDAEVVAALIDNGRRPRVTVAIDFYDTAPWIVDLIAGEVSVDAVRVPVDGAVAALRRRVVDLAVIPVSVIPTGISTTHLCDDHLVAVVPATSPLATLRALDAAELSRHPYLAAGLDPQRGFEFRELFAPTGHAPHHIVRIESLHTILAVVANGDGVTIQPSAAVPDDPRIARRPLHPKPILVRWIACTAEAPSDELADLIRRIGVNLSARVTEQHRGGPRADRRLPASPD